MIWPWIALGALVVLALWAGGTYNRLVMLRNRIENAWAQVQVQLKRRWDLIPNVVATVKGYATHEAETLEAVIAARNAASNAVGVADVAQAENALTGALRQLFAVAEAYPDLKANQNFLSLQAELTETENKIAYARQFFNDTVMTFNTTLEQFPTVILAGLFGFGRRDSFTVDEAESGPVAVSFEK